MPQAVKIANNIQTTKTRPTSKDIIKQIKMAKRIASNSPTPMTSSGQNSPRGLTGQSMPLRVYEAVGGKRYIPVDNSNRQPSPQSNAESSSSKQRMSKVSKSKTMKILLSSSQVIKF